VPLGELRMAATEEKLESEICLGEHAGAISELRVLLAEHPFRERLTELLMAGLYKSGRQAEALDAFDSMRRRLGDELGIDPGPALRMQHQRVLQADRGETWQITEHYRWPAWLSWLLLAVLFAAAVLNTAIRMISDGHTRHSVGAGPAPAAERP
jgi:Bacterial transcriptional activator domain